MPLLDNFLFSTPLKGCNAVITHNVMTLRYLFILKAYKSHLCTYLMPCYITYPWHPVTCDYWFPMIVKKSSLCFTDNGRTCTSHTGDARTCEQYSIWRSYENYSFEFDSIMMEHVHQLTLSSLELLAEITTILESDLCPY